MEDVRVERMTAARIPTREGEFQLCYYGDAQDGKEHLALVLGNVAGQENVLVRIHSECFTGDVLGSLRCDCGSQLRRAMQLIAAEGCGVIVYLRQEGRGIGLLDKLRAYNLQDEGYDTVDANLMLGHQADGRDYTAAALILQDLGIQSLRLLTNNPHKISHLQTAGLTITARVPLPAEVNPENLAYLKTKVEKMRHLLDLQPPLSANGHMLPEWLPELRPQYGRLPTRPTVTLSYAQSLDGSIAARRGQPTAISGPESLKLTHQLRANHDAILVGIGTVLADDPRLTVRLVPGKQPQPVVVDGRLRFPLNARLRHHPKPPLIVTTLQADPARQAVLEAAGLVVCRVEETRDGRVSLPALLAKLAEQGIGTVMVEGGAQIITSFLAAQLVDQMVITIAPRLLAGLPAVGHLNGQSLPHLFNPQYRQVGEDIVMVGEVVNSEQ
jgi:3,4-dihydroxy 2-butanone 4-phosphate synthase/GTP cyclohydrolase II